MPATARVANNVNPLLQQAARSIIFFTTIAMITTIIIISRSIHLPFLSVVNTSTPNLKSLIIGGTFFQERSPCETQKFQGQKRSGVMEMMVRVRRLS